EPGTATAGRDTPAQTAPIPRKTCLLDNIGPSIAEPAEKPHGPAASVVRGLERQRTGAARTCYKPSPDLEEAWKEEDG
ncbi:MAG: hypothetical protein RL685_5798, partial [Pseudomonadota bacterium]